MDGDFREVLRDLFMGAQLYGGFIASVTCQKVCNMQDPGKVTTVPPFTPHTALNPGVKRRKKQSNTDLCILLSQKGKGPWSYI